jgi:hypothetical protein
LYVFIAPLPILEREKKRLLKSAIYSLTLVAETKEEWSSGEFHVVVPIYYPDEFMILNEK